LKSERPIVHFRIVVVEVAIPPLCFRAGAGGGGLVVKALGPGIDAGEGELAGAMLKLDVQRVVVGVRDPRTVDISDEVRIGAAVYWQARGRFRSDGVAGRQVRDQQGLIDVLAGQQPAAFVANVVQLEGSVPGQFPLHGKRPLCHVWILRVF